MWVMRASVMYIQYLSNIFIAILENKTTQNKDEFWTLIPSNRQMALVFRGEKNPIIVPLHRCVRSRNQPQHLKHQHCSIFVNHISSMKYLMLEKFGSHLPACQPNSPQHSHNREDSELDLLAGRMH